MSLSSTTVTSMPHSSVWTSRISRMFWLMVSVFDSVSSSVWRPTTARSVGCAVWLIAAETFSIATTERTTSLAVVRDGRDVDADVVARDDALRLDRHPHDPQRHAVDAVGERDDEDQPGTARAVDDLPEPELHAALVLLEDPHRQRPEPERHEQHNDHIDDHVVSLSPACDAGDGTAIAEGRLTVRTMSASADERAQSDLPLRPSAPVTGPDVELPRCWTLDRCAGRLARRNRRSRRR